MAVELIKNERAITTLKPGTKRLNDGGGLYLLNLTGDGAGNYWRFDYTHEGRRKTLSLGVYPNIGLAQARSLAAKARQDLSEGFDPSTIRKARREQFQQRNEAADRIRNGLPAIGSFEEVMRRWFVIKSPQWMESYSNKAIRRLEMHALPKLGQLQMENITPKMVLDVCREIEKRDNLETAHRVRGLCSSVFRFAIAEGRDLRDPCTDIRDALKRPLVCHC